ncbi:CCHC-type domain-containing protein [Citrus sinensis]|nr:CCHC-type domain-containing protein [Citrus sinensis]
MLSITSSRILSEKEEVKAAFLREMNWLVAGVNVTVVCLSGLRLVGTLAVTSSASGLLKFKTAGAGDVLAKGLREACEMHVVEESMLGLLFKFYSTQITTVGIRARLTNQDPSMATPKIDLKKFNGKNDFNMWKVKMEALLVTQGLGDAIQSVTKKEGKEFSTSKTSEQVAEINRKARGTIILSVADSVIREVAKEPTVADLWAKLESSYMKKSLANMLYIKKRMFTLKMVEGTSLDDHFDEFNKVCDTLETIDAALDDEDKALMQTLSLDEVKSALNTKELQGHFKKDCPEKKLKKKWQNEGAAVAEEEGYEYAGVCIATDSKDKDCVLGTATRTSFKRSVHKSKDKLEYVHSDLLGLAQQISLGEEGIMRHKTVRLTPQQNDLAERTNMTLMERVRDVIFNKEELISKKSVQMKSEEDAKRHASIRVILSLTAVQDMELDQLDVKTAFLHGRLQEEIFMTQPEGYEDSNKPRHVCLLKKSLYGLKQSHRQWYLRFDEFIVTHGFIRCNYDCCVYYKLMKDDLYIYLILYVDDMLITCKIMEEIEGLKKILSSEFDMKNLGIAKKIMGVEIERNRAAGLMFLSQKKYLTRVLHSFQMLNSKLVVTPLAIHFRLSNLQSPKISEEKLEMEDVPYTNAVGCLMYAMVLTRPDISHALSIVSRYMAAPRKEHWKAMKWIMRYLSGTLSCGLVYGKNKGSCEGLLGFVDSDYAGDLDRRRSLTGYMFLFNDCLINWKATLQHVVDLSTTEAEYTAATEVVKEALWL